MERDYWILEKHVRMQFWSPLLVSGRHDLSRGLSKLYLKIQFLQLNAVQGNNDSLFWESFEVHKYAVWLNEGSVIINTGACASVIVTERAVSHFRKKIT